MSRDEVNVAAFLLYGADFAGALQEFTRGVLLHGLRFSPMAPARVCCKQGR
jgi:hypothetical protein